MRKRTALGLGVVTFAAAASAQAPPPPRPLPPAVLQTGFSQPAGTTATRPDLAKLPPLTQQLYLSAQRGGEWLFRTHQPTGRFLPGWQAALNRPVEGDHFLRQAGAAWALARAARYFQNDGYAARASQAVLTLLAETAPDPRDPLSRCTTLPSAVVNRLGAAGLLLAAIHELPAPADDLLDQGEQLARFVARRQQADGSFATTDTPEALADPDHVNHYPGMALYGLMRSHAKRPAAWKVEATRRAAAYYRAWFRDPKHRSPAFVAWQVPAFAEAFLAARDAGAAEFVFEMGDWLVTLQYDLDARHPQWRGGFPTFAHGQPAPGGPTAQSAAVAACLIEASRVTRQLPDGARFATYREAAQRALQFVTTLQYTDANTTHFAPVYRQQMLVGGFHGAPDDGDLRVEHAQHAVAALVQYLATE